MRANIGSLVGVWLLAAVAGCESSGDDGGGASVGPGWTAPPAPQPPIPLGAVVEGHFRDAAVEGLDYDAGAPLLGTTGADGGFQFAQGGKVAFRVGGVPLGSGLGQEYMSPVSLTPAFISPAEQVDNRLRFLQMLDFDGNPDNGILISNAVRAVAAGWGVVDFGSSNDAFAAAIAPLAVAANQADGVSSHSVPSVAAAREHFDRTFVCTYTGLYSGTFTGGDRGVWNLVVYGNGVMYGGAVSNVGGRGFTWAKTTPLAVTTVPSFQIAEDSGAIFTGDFRTPDLVIGVWTDLPFNGQFGGLRTGGSDDSVYRLSGYGVASGSSPVLVSLEIDDQNRVDGVLVDRDFQGTAEPIALSGALVGTAFTAQAADGRYRIDGTFDRAASPASRQFAGTLHDDVKSRAVALNLPACRLD